MSPTWVAGTQVLPSSPASPQGTQRQGAGTEPALEPGNVTVGCGCPEQPLNHEVHACPSPSEKRRAESLDVGGVGNSVWSKSATSGRDVAAHVSDSSSLQRKPAVSRLPEPARELKTTTKQNRTEAELRRGGGTALAGAGLLMPQNSENVPGCVPLRGRLRCTRWPSCPSGCLLSSLSTLHATVALSLHVHLWEECGWGQPAPSYFPDAPCQLR